MADALIKLPDGNVLFLLTPIKIQAILMREILVSLRGSAHFQQASLGTLRMRKHLTPRKPVFVSPHSAACPVDSALCQFNSHHTLNLEEEMSHLENPVSCEENAALSSQSMSNLSRAKRNNQ